MSEQYKKFLTKEILKKTKELALPKLDDIREYRENSDMFFSRIYCEAFMDALVASGYTITINKENVSYVIKKLD